VTKDNARNVNVQSKAMQMYAKLLHILRGKQTQIARLVLKRSEDATWFVRFVGFSASEVQCFSIAGI
jgi:hypothetical protein